MVAMVTTPPQMMADTVRATMRPIAAIAGDREVYRQKSLNLPGDNSVYRTVCWMLRWPR